MKSDIHRPCQDNCLHDPFFFLKSLGYVLLCNPIDCIVHGILQARVLEWVTFPFSRGSSQPRDSRSPTLQADSLPAEPSTMWGSLRTPRFKEKSCCPLGEDPALLQRLMCFIFSLLDCRELIWKANNATLSEGRYIGNRCSNSAWVHGPLRWIIPWLTSLPEALPPNWWLVENESPQRKGGGPQPADQGSEETASGSSGSRQRLSGEAGLGHRRVVAGPAGGEPRASRQGFQRDGWGQAGRPTAQPWPETVHGLAQALGLIGSRKLDGQNVSSISELGWEALFLIDWKLYKISCISFHLSADPGSPPVSNSHF